MIRLPHVYIYLKEKQTEQPITKGAFVSVQQDKIGEGFKELFKQTPDNTGLVDYEATSFTKYRIIGDGSEYEHNELLIDTGANIWQPIKEILYLEKRLVPLPDAPDIASLFRDVGLAQILPFVAVVVAIAVIVAAVAYVASRGLSLAETGQKAKAAAASAAANKAKEAAAANV